MFHRRPRGNRWYFSIVGAFPSFWHTNRIIHPVAGQRPFSCCIMWECLWGSTERADHPQTANIPSAPAPPNPSIPSSRSYIRRWKPVIPRWVGGSMRVSLVSRTIRFTFIKTTCSPKELLATGGIFRSQGHFRHFTPTIFSNTKFSTTPLARAKVTNALQGQRV
jgi:hypothetical protein